MFKVVYRTMSEEKAEMKAEELNGKVRVDDTAYVCESGFVGCVYVVVVEVKEEGSK